MEFDFDPSQLTIRVANRLDHEPSTGAARRQVIGAASRTLSFEAIFDGTSPDGPDDAKKGLSKLLHLGETRERVRLSSLSFVFEGIVLEVSKLPSTTSPDAGPSRPRASVSIEESRLETDAPESDVATPDLSG